MPTALTSGGNILDFNVCQSSDCESFDFNEETGVYSTSNSGGWGAPLNFDTTDAIGATLVVTLPDGTVCTGVTLYPTFPDSTSLLTQTITSANLGLTGSLPDGVYNMTYYVSITNVNSQTVVLQTNKTFLFTCSIKCCVDTLISKIATTDCDCESSTVKNALLAFSLYQALLNSGGCGNLTNVANLLARLQKLCSITDCGCS